LGADLESAVLENVSLAPATISDLAKRTGATRAAVHETVETLVARGLISKPKEGYRKFITVSPTFAEWLRYFPTA
jgi:DNA-binding IclR family transcriptional regulator